MTILVATSVVRGSQQGESHGGVYLIDCERDRSARALDWNTMNIDWRGRGWDRGLRGIACVEDGIYIAASDELFAFTPEFELIGSYRSPFLKHCHEICRYEQTLFLTSTGFDAILGFDLAARRFTFGLHVAAAGEAWRGTPFDPAAAQGPAPGNTLHLNNVFCDDRGMYLSGLRTGAVLVFTGRWINQWSTLPEGAHNARPWRDGLLFNDTSADVVRFVSSATQTAVRVPRYDQATLTHTELDDSRIARQAFGRGLCVVNDTLIAAGSSPSTVTLHDLAAGETLKSITLSRDLRNAIHGLEVWPFGRDIPADA